jgi:hypothetical protein
MLRHKLRALETIVERHGVFRPASLCLAVYLSTCLPTYLSTVSIGAFPRHLLSCSGKSFGAYPNHGFSA